MKKIVGILLAGAMVFSAFAADLTGAVRLEGDLFKYDGNTKKVEALMIKPHQESYWGPLTLSISSDRAGGTLKMWDGGADKLSVGKWAIWFKPMDMLKVNLGTIAKDLNKESIEYGGCLLGYDTFGASLDINVDAFSATIAVLPGSGSYWMTKEDGKDLVASGLNLYAQYAADFGTIKAMFDFSNTFKDIKVAAGYNKSFGDISIWGDVAFIKLDEIYVKDNDFRDTESLMIDFDVTYAKDAFNAQAYVQYDIKTFEEFETDYQALMLKAKVSYNMGSFTPYLVFTDKNIFADDFACMIKPGVTGSVGIMNYEVAVQFDVADKVIVSVPFNASVNF
jgi:hypothetical protein